MKIFLVVGDGIAGLSAAYYASKHASGPVAITLLESGPSCGGKITTERVKNVVPGESFVVEGGPDTIIVTKPWAARLCDELGIGDRLRGTNQEHKKTYILKNGKLHELPGGLTMMIPTEFGGMIRTGLLSLLEKARMGLDFILPAKNGHVDEALGGFVTRRLGRGAYENLIEPLMRSIYAGDGVQLSLQSTFPYLRDLEKKHGGLVKGALAACRECMKNGHAAAPGSHSLFLTPLTGLAEIVEKLVESLDRSGVEICVNTAGKNIKQRNPSHLAGAWQVELENGTTLDADALIMATPAYVTGRLLIETHTTLARKLQSIEYVSTATVSLAYRESDLSRPLDGYGYVIPRREGRQALACTWTSTKFPHRAPEGYALLRVFIGRAGQEGKIPWNETALLEIAREELHSTLGITAEPALSRVYQWEKAMPQYNLGHPDRLARIGNAVETLPGLALAGNGYHGIGIPDCIHSGEIAVGPVLQYCEAQQTQPLRDNV